jgi:hypothetical protein
MIVAQKQTVGLAKGAAGGGKKDGPRGTYTEPRDSRPTLAEAGIDKKGDPMKQKHHRVIDPAKARAAAGGGGGSFYDRIIPTQTARAACSRCGIHTAMIGAADGECLKCRLTRRNEVQAEKMAASATPRGPGAAIDVGVGG